MGLARTIGLGVALAVVLVLSSCSPSRRLVVQLSTDRTPLVEFDTIDVSIDDGPVETVGVHRGGGYAHAARLIDRTFDGTQASVRVTLRRDGMAVQSATRRTNVAGVTYLTVRISRSCASVTCTQPEATACLAGRCVSDQCTPENPSACPPLACDAATCTALATPCATAACAPEGVCVVEPDDDRCAASEVCDPTAGCTPVPMADAGPMDAAILADAGLDAGIDAPGPADTGADAGLDAGVDTGIDAGIDAGSDAGSDAGTDGGSDAGLDAFAGPLTDAGTGTMPMQLWARPYPVTSTLAASIAAAGDTLYVGVECDGTANLGGATLTGYGMIDACVGAFESADGTHRWSLAMGSPSSENHAWLAADESGAYVSFGFSGVAQAGAMSVTARASGDVAVAALDRATGATRWMMRTGEPAGFGEVAAGLSLGEGRLMVYASVPHAAGLGMMNPFLAHIDTGSGAEMLPTSYPSATLVTVNRMEASGTLTFVGAMTAGTFGGPLHGPSGASTGQLVQLAPDGTPIDTIRMASSSYLVVTDVDASIGGGLFAAGVFRADAQIPDAASGTLVASHAPPADYDVAIARVGGSSPWIVSTGASIAPVPVPIATNDDATHGGHTVFVAASAMTPTGPFGMGDFTMRGLFIAALDASSGAPLWVTRVESPDMLPIDVAYDASSGRLYVLATSSQGFFFGGRPVAIASGNNLVVLALATN